MSSLLDAELRRRSGLEQNEYEFAYGHDDDYSELGPDDSASQIGRAVHYGGAGGDRDRARRHPLGNREAPSSNENYTLQWATNGAGARPPYPRPDYPPTPTAQSRRTSLRSSRLLTATTHVPSRQDRVRYSWQSIHGDEPNRPRIHVIKIVSNTATASAGLPGGEAFGFSFSPGGRRIACYNSARLFILQTAALPVNISQEYALRKRPLAIEVVDEGGILAVLSDEHTINVYDLSHHRVRRLKTFKPDFATCAIALSPTGGLLAAAYENGVEIFSLDEKALSTDRRAARSEKMDKLVFSDDSSTLLGTTTRINAAATVVVSVPIFPQADNNIPTHEELKEAWCTNMLEPTNIVDSSHATFMREGGTLSNDKLFSWNGPEDTFGILSSEDVQYNNIDFPVTISPPLSTCGGLGAAIHSVPALDERGDTVGMIVNDRTIRLYVVPHADDETTKVEAHSIDHELDEEFGCPFSDIRWVHSSSSLPAPKGDPTQVSGRLVVVSPGGVADPSVAEEFVDDVEGGRIILFDFDPQFAGQPGQTFTLTLGKAPPQTLDEQEMDVAQEVALVRRRTVNASQKQKLNQRGVALGRTASKINRGPSDRLQPPQRSASSSGAANALERTAQWSAGRNRSNMSELSFTAGEGLANVDEANEAIEEPFDGNNPRSVVSLARAASAATSHRIQRIEERAAETASARENGFIPLPEYSEEPNAPLPSRYRALAGLDQPKMMGKKPQDKEDAKRDINGQMSLDTSQAGPSNSSDRTHTPNQTPSAQSPQPFTNSPLPRSIERAFSAAVSPLSPVARTPTATGNSSREIVSPVQRDGTSKAGLSPPPLSSSFSQPNLTAHTGGLSSPREPSRAEIEIRELEKRERERLERARIASRNKPLPEPSEPAPEPTQAQMRLSQHRLSEILAAQRLSKRLSSANFAPMPVDLESASAASRLQRSHSGPSPYGAGAARRESMSQQSSNSGGKRQHQSQSSKENIPAHVAALQQAFLSSSANGTSSSLFPPPSSSSTSSKAKKDASASASAAAAARRHSMLSPHHTNHSTPALTAGGWNEPPMPGSFPDPRQSWVSDNFSRPLSRASSRMTARSTNFRFGSGFGGGRDGGGGGAAAANAYRPASRRSINSAPVGGRYKKKRSLLGGWRQTRRYYEEDGQFVQDDSGRRCAIM